MKSLLRGDEDFSSNRNRAALTQFKTFRFLVETRKVEKGKRIEIGRESNYVRKDGLAILLCDGATTISIDDGLSSIWFPLRGEVWISDAGSRLGVSKRFMYISDSNRPYGAEISAAGACVAVVGSQTTWSAINAFGNVEQTGTPAIFPALHSLSVQTRRDMI